MDKSDVGEHPAHISNSVTFRYLAQVAATVPAINFPVTWRFMQKSTCSASRVENVAAQERAGIAHYLLKRPGWHPGCHSHSPCIQAVTLSLGLHRRMRFHTACPSQVEQATLDDSTSRSNFGQQHKQASETYQLKGTLFDTAQRLASTLAPDYRHQHCTPWTETFQQDDASRLQVTHVRQPL